jgi:hypothetical protein
MTQISWQIIIFKGKSLELPVTMEMEMGKGILNDKFLEKNATGIYDHPEQSYFEFYPAGYAHYTKTQISRQTFHKQIFEQAVKENPDISNIENIIFPLDVDEHSIVLVKDRNNPVDPFAFSIFLLVGNQRFDIGFVPLKISKYIHQNYDRITEGRIYRVKEKAYGKYYSTKVIIGYDEYRFFGKNTSTYERLADIIDELNED